MSRSTRIEPAMPATTKKLRCAVYTRKSTDEGLEKEFSTLDAQRDSCEAYITSQRAEGWLLVRDRYDDGGFSGGTLERPALQRLLRDMGDGKVVETEARIVHLGAVRVLASDGVEVDLDIGGRGCAANGVGADGSFDPGRDGGEAQPQCWVTYDHQEAQLSPPLVRAVASIWHLVCGRLTIRGTGL